MGARILVTGAGGDSAQGVIRALRKAPCDYVIASVCIGQQSPGLHMSDIWGIAPPIKSEREYVEFLIEFVRQHAIDIIIPTIDGELLLMCRCRSEIEHLTQSKVILGSSESVAICADKLATSRYLSDVAVGQPVTMTVADETKISDMVNSGAKVIMKPRMGGGSKGIRILDAAALEVADWLSGDNIYQHFDEYSKEFTAVIMKDGGSVVATAVFERILSGGRTVWCKRVPAMEYKDMLKTVAHGLDIPYLNIQFGVDKGVPHVFDLNPRFSGSTAVFSEVFNGPHLLVQRHINGVMPPFSCSAVYFESVRYFEDLIFNRHAY